MDCNDSSFGLHEEQHNGVIIHIDIDCFYAQVEEIRNPSLRNKPVGIQQKNIVVTCNYVARTFGVKKLMLLTDALRLCPELVLVNGEDLTPYRQMSTKIHNILLTYTPCVEKLGLDENFLDVTSIIDAKQNADLDHSTIGENMLFADCHIFPEYETLSSCGCGCEKRLILGARLAREIRQKLHDELEITSCAGIAHNKLLAKIIGTKNKPNKQTVLIPACTNDVMLALDSIRSIPGIGQKAEQTLNEAGVRTVKELQDIEFSVLQRLFGLETSTKYKNWSKGIDKSLVVPSGKPKTISLEDSCRSISFRTDVEEKFRLLLIRLVNQVAEDGRIPLAVKIIVRKYDAAKKSSHRETKQANILPSLFKELGNGKVVLVENGQEKLLKIVMRLFERVVNLKLPFNITLLGLAFSKFQERNLRSRSIANFLIRTTDLEVQSVTSLSSDGLQSIKNYQLRGSPTQMDFDTTSEASHASYSSDVSESEIEPSPKKNRFAFSFAKRRCLQATNTSSTDMASPSKLRTFAELRLNSKESDCDMQTAVNHEINVVTTPTETPVSSIAGECMSETSNNSTELAMPTDQAMTNPTKHISGATFPPIVDPEVFKSLPFDVQEELLSQWRTPDTPPPPPSLTQESHSHANIAIKTRNGSKKSKTNTLHRYFITNN